MLDAHPGKAVVFTEFVATLDHLQRVCEQRGISHVIFKGELSRAEKDAAIARFRDEARVLLSTGAGGEGRNLQCADTIVNFDLPWNPMRIEQRVGRVHRIGQSRDVFVFNYCQEGTVEEQLLRVLHDKINMFSWWWARWMPSWGRSTTARTSQRVELDRRPGIRRRGEVRRIGGTVVGRRISMKVQQLTTALRDFEV
jgi:superfamily II DNA/RNA helicase